MLLRTETNHKTRALLSGEIIFCLDSGTLWCWKRNVWLENNERVQFFYSCVTYFTTRKLVFPPERRSWFVMVAIRRSYRFSAFEKMCDLGNWSKNWLILGYMLGIMSTWILRIFFDQSRKRKKGRNREKSDKRGEQRKNFS